MLAEVFNAIGVTGGLETAIELIVTGLAVYTGVDLFKSKIAPKTE